MEIIFFIILFCVALLSVQSAFKKRKTIHTRILQILSKIKHYIQRILIIIAIKSKVMIHKTTFLSKIKKKAINTNYRF